MAALRPLAHLALACLALGCERDISRGSPSTYMRPPAVVQEPLSEPPPAPAPAPEAVAPPADGDDLLFYVNRTHAIPSEYPLSSTSIWTPCSYEPAPSQRKHDLMCLPAAYTHRVREALRRTAFESNAPHDLETTHDGLSVGRAGKVGFRPLLDAAREAGFELFVKSGFRAYATQSATFAMWVAQELAQGRSREDALRRVTRFSARAGHSEHQLGTTVDLVFRAENGLIYDGWDPKTIAASPAIRWVKANAHRFGVVLTYDEGHEDVTQYAWEPWHWRYVGVVAADVMHARGLSTEEYLQARYGEAPQAPFPPHGSRNARR